MKKTCFIFISLFLVLIFTEACRRKSDNPLWNVDALAPLLQTSLTLENILRDTSSSIQKNGDNSITVVLREEVASITTDSLVTLSVSPYTKSIKLNTLVLNDQAVTRNITLGELCRALIASGNITNILIGNALLNSQGGSFPLPPTINNLSATNLVLNIEQFFDDATFISGDMEIRVNNNLPMDIASLQFEARNNVLGNQVANQTFTAIPRFGGSQTQVVDLAGKTVEGNLTLNLLDLDLIGGTTEIIDTNAAITLNITIRNVSLSAATAIFPEQNVIDNTENIVLEGLDEIELYEAWIASGNVVASITSSLKSQFDVTYFIPGATKNSVPFSISRTIPKATNQNVVVTIIEDFSAYQMNLRGDDNLQFNTFSNRIVGKIPFTGEKVRITLDDSVDVIVTLQNPIPSFVRGYLGRDTAQIGPNRLSLGLFSKIESGTLNFEEVNINMVVENSLGITGAIKINEVTAENTRTGQSVTMTGPSIGSTITIGKAINVLPIVPVVTSVNISAGSNATSLLSILPDQFIYDVQVIANPTGNDLSYNDFAYSSAGLKALLEIEMPLSFDANSLTLSDTILFNTAALQKKNVNEGVFTIHANNGFPLDATLKMYFLDQLDYVIDSLSSPGAILAGPVNAQNRVTEKRKSVVDYTINASKMANIYNASKVIFKVQFSTQPSSTFLKLYSDYAIDFKLIGDVNYSIR